MISTLDGVIHVVLKDLPLADHVRFVVGPLASRESVKDRFIELSENSIIPGFAVATLPEIASEILNTARIPFEKPLSSADRIDALQTVSSRKKIAERLPNLSFQLKKRDVAAKLSRLLLSLDRFIANGDELDAVIESFVEKKPEVAEFLSIIARLWKTGELSPWSDYSNVREVLNRQPDNFNGKTLYLWGFQEFTPVEENFLDFLKLRNKVVFVMPEPLRKSMGTKCSKAGIEMLVLKNEREVRPIRMLKPHMLIDEIHFLTDEIRKLNEAGIPFSEIGVFVPQDDLFKRLLRQKLHELHVPMQDPSLADSWIDHPDWVYWRDFLSCLAKGMGVEDVKALCAHDLDLEFQKVIFDLRITHGAASWKRFLAIHPNPTIEALLLVFRSLVQFQTPLELYTTFEDVLPKLQSLIQKDTTILETFLKHLAFERPYLQGVHARLNRYVDYFEEFLKAESRKNSIRSSQGLWVLAHQVWVPKTLHTVFVLSSHTISRAQPSFDPWEWEGLEVRRAWERLHFGMPFKERIERDFSILEAGLLNHKHVYLSTLTYDLDGKPLPKGFFAGKLKDGGKVEIEEVKAGGHLQTGWLHHRPIQTSNTIHKLIGSESFKKLLSKPLSVTKFEDYLDCPYLFYGRHLLKLDESFELDLIPSAMAKGNLIHKVLETIIRDEIEKKEPFHLDHGKMRKKATAILDELLTKEKIDGLFQGSALFKSARDEIFSRINFWIDWEITYRMTHPSMKPFAVEVPLDLVLKPVDGPELKLKGIVDRIDSDGSKCTIIDYKTGDAPYIGKQLLAGLGAQLVAYANAIERKFNLEPVASYYLTLKKESKISGGIFNKGFNKTHFTIGPRNSGVTEKSFKEIYDTVFEVWEKKAHSLQEGDFSAVPTDPKNCDSCTFNGICGFTGGAR